MSSRRRRCRCTPTRCTASTRPRRPSASRRARLQSRQARLPRRHRRPTAADAAATRHRRRRRHRPRSTAWGPLATMARARRRAVADRCAARTPSRGRSRTAVWTAYAHGHVDCASCNTHACHSHNPHSHNPHSHNPHNHNPHSHNPHSHTPWPTWAEPELLERLWQHVRAVLLWHRPFCCRDMSTRNGCRGQGIGLAPLPHVRRNACRPAPRGRVVR